MRAPEGRERLKICIPIAFRPEGGGFYFLQTFEQYLTTQGHLVCSDLGDSYDVLFTSHWLVSRHKILQGLRASPSARVVHRIDGAAADYGRDPEADRRQRKINRLADLTIFQSEYARLVTRDRFHVIEQDGPVIHNPVDTVRFSPEGDHLPLPESERVVSVSWSTNPKKGAMALYDTASRHPEIGFYLCGRYVDVPTLPNLHPLGVLDRPALAALLRSCHALLTYSENEACPNHVLEAMASGLPVLFRDSGAMAEIIGDCGVAVEPASFGAHFKSMMSAHSEWSARSRLRATTHFQPDNVFRTYTREIEGALRRPTKVGRLRRMFLSRFSSLTHY